MQITPGLVAEGENPGFVESLWSQIGTGHGDARRILARYSLQIPANGLVA